MHDAGHTEEKKTQISLELCDHGEKKYDATVFHKLSVSPKQFSTKSIYVPVKISFLQYPGTVYDTSLFGETLLKLINLLEF